MSFSAIVSASGTGFCATLSDGRCIAVEDLFALAKALYRLGLPAHAIQFEWHAGQRMMTAGQQVALAADMRYLARESAETPLAA